MGWRFWGRGRGSGEMSSHGQSEGQPDAKIPSVETFEIRYFSGQEVNVLRRSGDMESGWFVPYDQEYDGKPEDPIRVVKTKDGTIHGDFVADKIVLRKHLMEWNS